MKKSNDEIWVKGIYKDEKINLVAYEMAKAFGYLSEFETFAMYSMVKSLCFESNRALIMVNIGVGTGTSSLAMREACPHGVVVSVDMRNHPNPYGGLENERNAYTQHPELKHPIQVHSDSSLFGRYWNEKDVDFLFIDGDHSTEGVTKDIEAWLPKVVKGGIVAFHDYEPPIMHSQVKPVVDKLMKDHKRLVAVHRILFYEVL